MGAILAVLGILGALAVWRSTPYGLGLVNDTASYVGGAQNLLAGHGYVRTSGGGELKPITHFPPLFSLFLALWGAAGFNLLNAARVMISLLYCLDVVLVGWLIYRLSGSVPFSLLGAALLAVSDTFLKVYSFLLSEPLYLTWLLVTFLCLVEYFRSQKFRWIILCGLAAGLAYLTRYAGLALFASTFAGLLFLESHVQRPFRLPVQPLLGLAAGFFLPIAAWAITNAFITPRGVADPLGNRQFAWHPIALSALFDGLKNQLTWAAPDVWLKAVPQIGYLFSGLSLLALASLAVWLAWVMWKAWRVNTESYQASAQEKSIFALGLHFLTYIAFLVMTISLLDASTPLNDRIFSPAYLVGLVLFCVGCAALWRSTGERRLLTRRMVQSAVLLTCALLVLSGVQDGAAAVQVLSREGQGFAYREISQSPAIPAVQQLPASMILYSNRPTALLLLADRPAYILPTEIDAVTLESRPDYPAELEDMLSQVKAGKAALVLFAMRNSSDPQEADFYNQVAAELPVWGDYGSIVIFAAR